MISKHPVVGAYSNLLDISDSLHIPGGFPDSISVVLVGPAPILVLAHMVMV